MGAKVKVTAALFLAASCAVTIQPTSAQNYSIKSIRLIVPFGAGTETDVGARIYAVKLSEAIGQVIVVDNRPGREA
jgi:tripartite-type tricarboxylate transporter receptor subunit TctC